MGKVRKNSTEFTAKKPADPAQGTPADSSSAAPEPEAPADPSGRSRAFLVAILIWALGFLLLIGTILYDSVAEFIGFLRNSLGW